MRTESLSFTLRQANTHDDLLRACKVRADAYGHKVPAYRESMSRPDALDSSPSTAIFICEDKISGRPVGTMRVQMRRHDKGELAMERYVELPVRLRKSTRIEVSRLAAPVGSDPFVRLALWKAAYLLCATQAIGWILMSVRKPSLIRAYQRMGSVDLFPERSEGFVLPYVGPLPHRIYALDIDNFYSFWSDSNHPLLEFMTSTLHEDIQIIQPSMNSLPVVGIRPGVVK